MNYEQRQTICISNYAYKVMQEDLITFGTNLTNIINTVIFNSYEYSEASITLQLNELAEKLCMLAGINKCEMQADSPQAQLIRKIIKQREYELEGRQKRYSKEHNINIRLQNRLAELVTYHSPMSDECRGEKAHYKTRADYFKSLFEEYSRKTEYQRHAIFCKEVIEDISMIIENDMHRICRITVKGHDLDVKYGHNKLAKLNNDVNHEMTWLVKPIRIIQEYEQQFPSLLCLCSYDAIGNKYYYANIPMIDILNIKELGVNKGGGYINQKEIRQAQHILDSTNFHHSSLQIKSYNLYVTEKGLQYINTHQDGRPFCRNVKEKANNIYVLDCEGTEKQLILYFYDIKNEVNGVMIKHLLERCDHYGELHILNSF